jgi:hypothetical protein
LQESDHGHDYVKLLDFGIADSPQHAQSSFKLEKPRTVSGSPAYMSPEQCQGLELDGRSDIYSLAIVVFEMLTGCRPFPQKDNVNVMVLHVNDPPMSMSYVRPDLYFPPQVENVIAKALSKQPSARQANVQDFLLEFRQAWQTEEYFPSVLAKSVETKIDSLDDLTQLDKGENSKTITSDEFVIQKGDNLVSAWGNVSMEASNQIAPGIEKGFVLVHSQNTTGDDEESPLFKVWTPPVEDKAVPNLNNDEATLVNEDLPATIVGKDLPSENCDIAESILPSESPADKKITGQMPAASAKIATQIDLGLFETYPQPGVPVVQKEPINEIQPPAEPALPDFKEQTISRGKTIDRLIEAAQRGQTDQKISSKIISNQDASKSVAPKIEQQKLPSANSSFIHAQNVMANLNASDVGTENVSPTASGWYPLQNRSINNIPAPQKSLSEKPVSSNKPADDIVKEDKYSVSSVSTPIIPENSLAKPIFSGTDPVSAVPRAAVTDSYIERAKNDSRLSLSINNEIPLPVQDLVEQRPLARPRTPDLMTSTWHGPDNATESEFYIKQKYHNTISRLEGFNKKRRADNSLISTRARAAALKAESDRPPLNLWHFAITIIISASLLASAYVVYSALILPLPTEVVSIQTLLEIGNYEQIIDILEGKKLSEPLSDAENKQLNTAYLNMAKQSIAKNNANQAMSFLSKIDPKSPLAAQAVTIKANLAAQNKKNMHK